MNRSGSARTWGALLAVLVLSGLVTVTWPILRSSLSGGTTSVPVEIDTYEFALPVAIGGLESVTLASWQLLAIMGALVVPLVVGSGIALTVVYRLLSNQTTMAYEDEEIRAKLTNLEEREQATLDRLMEGREVAEDAEQSGSAWPAWGTALIILLFVLCFALLVNATFYPTGEVISGSRIVNTSTWLVGLPVLLTALYLAWRVRPQKIQAIDETDYAPIPWDSIVVLTLGLLVVGLGVALMVFLNVPS